MFPGKLARRVIWSSRIQRAAERDAADLARTPGPAAAVADAASGRERLPERRHRRAARQG
ncbi:hypothetical protein [Sorangium sp. So ce394]|uniref:hypothetical protein n=1 Tax=Sorangium sp. So ce394 TaxID=3133310 RepID=UPI003F5B667C